MESIKIVSSKLNFEYQINLYADGSILINQISKGKIKESVWFSPEEAYEFRYFIRNSIQNQKDLEGG